MKKIFKLKGILCIILAMALLTVCITPTPTEAKSLKAPKLGSWKDVTPTDIEGDGVRYEIRWKPISGKNISYQIEYFEREAPGEKWYTYKEPTDACYASLDFSSLYQFKVKVRTVKTTKTKDGYKYKYSKWVTSKTFTTH